MRTGAVVTIGPLDVLRTWAEENITAITRSRERYDVA
jgi:hypothetical protein